MAVSSYQVSGVSRSQKRYQQIDVMKGVAIVAVILLHALEREALLASYSIFHIWQAVPLFMILMGLNTGLTATGQRLLLSEYFSKKYFKSKANRILLPLLLVYIVSVVAGYIWLMLYDEDKLVFDALNFIGKLPLTGRGNYFVTLILQSIFLLPVIGSMYQRRPRLAIMLLITLEVLFLLWCNRIPAREEEDYIYSGAFPRYFSAIAFGLALSGVVVRRFKWVHFFVLGLLAGAGAIVLYQVTYGGYNIGFIKPEWQAQHVLTFGYAALLILLLFRLLPQHSENKLLGLLAALGRASYHIFLIQIVYFGLFSTGVVAWQALLCCLLIGYLFYKLDAKYYFGLTS